MSMVGTFDGFTAARLGIYAAQHGLRVTGNNVSNINTLGYTRQRVDQYSFKAGANDMYRSLYDNHVGSGALVQGINQIRDPYLDIRYRNASTDTYHYDTWLAGLQNIASILDEVGKGDNEDGLIYRQIQDLAEKLRAYSADPTELNDRLVRNSATSLTALFHNAATRLEKLYNETVNEFNENVSAVNEILLNIRDLNKSIREAEIHGDHALEMRDERNRQIDALSQYLDIKVEYSYEDVGGGIQVEKLTIKLNDANPDSAVHTDESILVDGVFATQLSVPEYKVALNIYSEDYPYLGNSNYLKMISGDELTAYLNEHGLTVDQMLQAWDENGDPLFDENNQPIYLIGADDPDVGGIFKVKNDNFTIQLDKLLNVKGEAWKSTTTAWLEVDRATALANATFSFPVTITDKTSSPLEFTIKDSEGNVLRTVSIPIDDSTTNEDIVAEIANQLNASGKYPDYDVYSDGTNILFKLKDTADPNTAEPPALSVTIEGGGPSWLSVGKRTSVPAETYDEHGNVTESVSYVQVDGKWYEVTIATKHTHEVTLDDNDLHGILQAQRELLTEEGEFSSEKDVAIDESALLKRGIPYYQKSLDLLAQKFAQAYNQLNKGFLYNQDGNYIDAEGKELLAYDLNAVNEDGTVGGLRPISADGLTEGQRLNILVNSYVLQDDEGYVIDENGNRITDENGEFIKAEDITLDNVTSGVISQEVYDKLIVDMDRFMKGEFGIEPTGGSLFTQLDGETTDGITAANISISAGWSNGVYGLIPTFMMLFKEDGNGGLTHSTQNDNADHMVAMIEKALTYNPRDLYGSDAIGPELFSGSFNDMLSNMMAVQGEDASITSVRLTTYATALNELDYSREGVSGVDLNDEAMNMVTYQKAMTAAMRVMTAIDEALDRLINNTGLAGR